MTPRTMRALALVAGTAVLATGCGSGSDDDGAAAGVLTTPAASAVPSTETDVFTQVQDGGDPATDPVSPDASVDEATTTTAGDAPTSADDDESAGEPAEASAATVVGEGTGDSSGAGDDALESLDDAGVDLDELEDDLDDFNTGEGGGAITVDGVTYKFEGELCIVADGDFIVEGMGATSDGIPFWGSISASSGFDFDGDGTPDDTLDILVEVGKEELFGSAADDQPDLSATKLDSATMQLGEDIEYTIDGTRISGSGPIEDFNSVLEPLGETLPMTFEGSCA